MTEPTTEPTVAEQLETYYTLEDNQSAEPGGNRQISDGNLAVPPGTKRGYEIATTFRLDRSGLLHVTAAGEDGQALQLDVRTD